MIELFCLIDPTLILSDDCHIRSHTVIYAGAQIGGQFVTGNGAQIYAATIGNCVTVGTHSVIEAGAVLHDHVTVHTGAFVCSYTIIEEWAWIGPHVVFVNTKYPHTATSHTERLSTVVGRGAKIGGNATILPGVKIGAGALVGAGAVVTKDVPERAVVVGNPAKVLRYL